MEINRPHVYLQYLTITAPLSYQPPCGSFDHRAEGRISLCLFLLRILTFGRVFALLVLCQGITGSIGWAELGEDKREKAPIRESWEENLHSSLTVQFCCPDLAGRSGIGKVEFFQRQWAVPATGTTPTKPGCGVFSNWNMLLLLFLFLSEARLLSDAPGETTSSPPCISVWGISN